MARRRKSDSKTVVKPLKSSAVRKSSRQMAKKQQEGQKVNGDIVPNACANSADGSKEAVDDKSVKKIVVPKKLTRYKRTSSSDKVGLEDINDSETKTGDSDSQDGSESASNSADKDSEDSQRAEVISNEVIWSEDVIEETIICEEMEVEEDLADNNSNTTQEGSVLIEQVLLINEPEYEGNSVVEFTVIQNEDGTESMMMSSDEQKLPANEDCKDTCNTSMIEKGLDRLQMSEFDIIGTSRKDEMLAETDEHNESTSFNSNRNDNKKSDPNVLNKDCKFLRGNRVVPFSTKTSKSTSRKIVNPSISEKETNLCTIDSNFGKKIDTNNESIALALSSLHQESIKGSTEERIIESKSSNASPSNPMSIVSSFLGLVGLSSSADHEDENSSSMSEKIEPETEDGSTSYYAEEKKNRSVDPMKITSNVDGKNNPHNRVSTKSKTLLLGNEEHSRDSELDGKPDYEDTKMSSSSENSSDTLLSSSSYKTLEINNKNSVLTVNDNDKKGGARSQSGGTVTAEMKKDSELNSSSQSQSGTSARTESEKDSEWNPNSGVRRSRRIRTIGLMKQRSRGRGLVTKPSDATKNVLQQERDKMTTNTLMPIQESKEYTDSGSEVSLDKESSGNKTPVTQDTSKPPISSSGMTSYDSDSSKPVKVKSRWRRSSELEMCGSGSGSAMHRLGVGCTSSAPNAGAAPNAVNEAATKASPTGSTQESRDYVDSKTAVAAIKNNFDSNNSETSFIANAPENVMSMPKTVGAKIFLPMVPEVADREMEERLSQFEHLRENLYLTDRFTSKETKRMLCDCFLTEEDIERGELGCGEDCLNRLLMIECCSRCIVGGRCTNKRFQNCEYAKCEVFRTEKKGFGLRAMVDLYPGEFIMEYVGEVVAPRDFRRRAKEYSKDKNRHYYFMALKSDQIIDATMKGNVSRFINHSCDPNSETQKWTVNGELRIGFFIKKSVVAGEEITFDYHFQRYGKEAQKCYCEALNCRGWIGDNPNDKKSKMKTKVEIDMPEEDEEEEEEEEVEEAQQATKPEKQIRRRKVEKKVTDHMEDEDLEEEIDKLCVGGLKNRTHTLNLSRLMVRSREIQHRTRLLKVIQSGEQPCRRLFLDYHGLRLIWSYMMDVAGNDSNESQQFRLEILKSLNTLPIPNKTMLMDSKVFSVVEKWSKEQFSSPNSQSPEEEQEKQKTKDEEIDITAENNEKDLERLNQVNEKLEKMVEGAQAKTEVKTESPESLIPELACNLLASWSNLKEVFRIPKKERIEQMKEHEREADFGKSSLAVRHRGYREELEKESGRETSYDRRYGRNESDKRSDRRRGRESPDFEHGRTKEKRVEDRPNLTPVPRMTKFERRQLFAMKVAKEEEERQRRQQQDSWQEHEARCLALGMDPYTTAAFDPQTGFPLFFNPTLGQWQHYPMQEGEIAQQCTPVYIGGTQGLSGPSPGNMVPQNLPVLPTGIPPVLPVPGIPPGMPADMSPGLSARGPPPPIYSMNQSTTAYNQAGLTYPPPLPHTPIQQFPDNSLQIASNLVQIHNGTPPITINTQPVYIEKTSDIPIPVGEPKSEPRPTPSPALTPSPAPSVSKVDGPPPLDLPPMWKWAKDARGRIYYYHVKERVAQWLPPPPDHIGVQPDSSTSSESSDESTSSNDEEDEEDDNASTEGMEAEPSLPESSSKVLPLRPPIVGAGIAAVQDVRKRRDGLVQERIISPRREEDRVDHKKYKEIKKKLRRQKERAKLKEHMDKLRKHWRSSKSKSHNRHGTSKFQPITSDMSPTTERKIKDTFRINMANVMVHFLNPYRKSDCKQGRITNTEDFKHLARKLTHFVLAKELKHCKSVDELQCNDNVKHKAKDFVRKYMNKFGAVYQKGTDED